VFTGNKAEIPLRLAPQILQNDLNLIFSANHMVFFVITVFSFFFLLLIVFILNTGRERKARVTLEKISLLLELFLVLRVSIILKVDEKLVYYAAKTP
jgi:hypothetical protein